MSDMTATLDVLREAIRDHREVWLGYVDAQGVRSNLFVTPLAVGGGVLEARDRAHNEIRHFTLHRITSVTLADDPTST